MFSTKTSIVPDELDKVIDLALLELQDHSAMSDEYAHIIKQIEKLYALKAPKKDQKAVDPNTLLTVMGNLAGIGLILNYERLHVVTSKALGFVLKSKV